MSISHQFLKEILDYNQETGVLIYKKQRRGLPVGSRAGYVHKTGYRYIGFDGKSYKEHRLIWFYVYGVWPDGDIDHINGVQDDNRISNLRVVNDSLNCLNKNWVSPDNKSGFRGVSYHKSERGKPKWRVRVTNGKKRISIGNFDSLDDAINARIAAENLYYGDYAPSKCCMSGGGGAHGA